MWKWLKQYRLYCIFLLLFLITFFVVKERLLLKKVEGQAIIPLASSAQIGTNLSAIRDWSPALPFLDGFKSSRPWIPQTNNIWDTQEANLLVLDEKGWVRFLPTTGTIYKKVSTLMYADLQGRYPGGDYLVLYEGEGKLEYQWDAVKNESLSRPQREVIQVTPNRGILLSITATNPNNYLRNIRVIPASVEKTYLTQPFNPAYLETIKPFSTFRFMDWMATNNSEQVNWRDRPTLESATWSRKGVPVEIMVTLANLTQTHVWFCLPHQADDNYVKQFAQYVKKNLDPKLKIYVEYSNEVWNRQFKQHFWVQEQAKQLWTEDNINNFTKTINWYSKRTTEIVQQWKTIFQDEKDRVVGVMAAQFANDWTAKQALSYAWTTSPQKHADYGIEAIAIAPYFGNYLGKPKYQEEIGSWLTEKDGGLTHLFQELTEGGQLKDGPKMGALKTVYQQIEAYKNLADQNGLQLVAYEGGQHLAAVGKVSQDEGIVNLFIRANRDPRMGEIYDHYLTQWQNLTTGLFLNFTDISRYGKSGSWGALEHVNDSGSPKYDALLKRVKSS